MDVEAEGTRMEGKLAKDVVSRDDVHEAIERLSAAEKRRIMMYAEYLAPRCKIEPADLAQEALVRLLGGGRTCPRDVPFPNVICGVMRSIATTAARSGAALKKDEMMLDGVMRASGAIAPDGELVALSVSPEQSAISALDHAATLMLINASVEDDVELQCLLEGIQEEMRGEDLQELLGVDKKGLASLRRRLRRRLEAAVEKGEQP